MALTKLVVLYPKLIILVPILLVFLLSYPVTYDFTIKSFNASLAQLWHPTPGAGQLPFGHGVFRRLQSELPGLGSMSRFTFTSLLDTHDVLDCEFLHLFLDFQLQIGRQFEAAIIVSPLNTWPLQLTDSSKPALLNYVNYECTSIQSSLHLNDIVTENHLITSAHEINMYVIYPSTDDVPSYVASLASHSAGLNLQEVTTTTSSQSIDDFRAFYVRENTRSPYRALYRVFGVFKWLLYASIVLYIYLCISNEHNIRAVFQLICGWVTEVLVSCTAAVNVFRLMYGYPTWELAFQPLTSFSRLSYIVIILMFSLRNLLRIIDDLNCRNSYESSSDVHKRLFRFYTGSSLLRTGDNLKVKIIRRVFGGMSNDDLDPLLMPNISKIMIANYFGLLALYFLLKSIFMLTLSGNSLRLLLARLLQFFQIIALALIIDQALQLTYLTGIIIIDQKRLELADLLQYEQDDVRSGDRIRDVNAFSSFLLQLKLSRQSRPSRGTLRYRLGRFLLTVRHVDLIRPWFFIVPLIILVYILGVAMSWSLLIPFVLMNDELKIFNLEDVKIHNTNNNVYYLEQALIVVFFVAITNLIFSFTHTEHSVVQSRTLSAEKNESGIASFTDDMKQFKSIDLEGGHSIDIAGITTNVHCPFLITTGLDKKILVWSPLIKPVPEPINISTVMTVGGIRRIFWPVNHCGISNDGNLIVLLNFRHSVIKMFERASMRFVWEKDMDMLPHGAIGKKAKILESFFRKRTVPGFLARKMLEKKRQAKTPRRASATSMMSTSSMNGDFSVPEIAGLTAVVEASGSDGFSNWLSSEDQELAYEYVMVLSDGHFVTITCKSGAMTCVNFLTETYLETAGLHMLSVKRLVTPRVRDRIVCHVSNGDVLVATVVNNKWTCRILEVQREIYNTGASHTILEALIPPPVIYNPATDSFDSPPGSGSGISVSGEAIPIALAARRLVGGSAIATVDFVGMVVVVHGLLAELIDVLTGVVLRSFGIGHFKHLSFRVTHLEPTHCKFCGCASIQSLSIIYEDYYSNTLMVHTFHTDGKRAKSNICLRVERDPREIRCQGFEAVDEEMHWLDDVEKWEVTSVNMVMGVQRRNFERKEESVPAVVNNDHIQLRSRKALAVPRKKAGFAAKWTGFVLSAASGRKTEYQIPHDEDKLRMIVNRVNCIRPYGYKSVALTFGNVTKIIYLGNNKLIENELYFSGAQAGSAMDSLLEEEDPSYEPEHNMLGRETKALNSELLFISKRRKMRERTARPFR